MAATNEFMHHLSMAACEWFLMFLMYLDAALGFILTKFAHQCELQTPCLFCFRFDHVFGDEPDCYFSHFCDNHRVEVSCLVSCNLHHKLSDVRHMCDDCFIPTMRRNDCLSVPKPLWNKNVVRAPSSAGLCSCCKKQWKPKPRNQIKLGLPKVMRQPPLPLITGRYRRRKNFKKARDKISGTTTPVHVDDNIRVDVDIDAVSDSGCAELKFNSCSGSESGDSFYEIECENEGFEDFACVLLHPAEHTKSVSISNLEHSLLNGTCNESVISPISLKSNGSIGHLVKENMTREVGNETLSVNQDLHNESVISPLSVASNGSIMNKVKENGLFNPDLHSVNDDVASSSSDKHEGYESPGTHSVGDIKSETDIEKLKRQMERDHEQLLLLHKELEEERNAAAIAADEAMAMITRLQEEKSALHMEALQYLRMMDEQAEYDMEALDKANDLVTEKDKEIQDLEAELEYFRSRYESESNMGNGKIDSVESKAQVFDLEDEKKHILNSISELEQKSHQFSNGTLENEISVLKEWLEAVESDQDFLEHACNTVQSHVGVEFIQQIAKHLHDLRRVRFDRRSQTVD